MAINELIARGANPIEIESPVNRLAKMLQIQGAQQNIARGEMEQDKYRQGVEQSNRLLEMYRGRAQDETDDAFNARLRAGGFAKNAIDNEEFADKRRKASVEASAKEIETAMKKLDIAGSAFNQVRQSPTLENANAVLDYLGSNRVYTREQVAEYKAQVAANPADIGRLADIAFRSAIDAKDQLAKNTSENLGGNMAYNSTDPLTGKVTQTGLVPITQSADNAATAKAAADRLQAEIAARAREAALGRSNTMEIAKMADTRQREANTDGYSTKPLPTAALKMQNDAIDVIGAAGGINKMLSGVEKQIEDKKVKFGPVSNLMNQGLNAAGMSTEESRNFSSFKSNLEKIRNESLRLNSGVQTDGDAQRAWNELFQNINDTELVKQRLGEIKSLNNRAVELQKLKVDGIRANYKAAPYDYGKLPDAGGATPPAALNPQDAQALAWANANPNDPRAAKIKQRLGQ